MKPILHNTPQTIKLTNLIQVFLLLGTLFVSTYSYGVEMQGSYTSFGKIEQIELFASQQPTDFQLEVLRNSLIQLHHIRLFQAHPLPFFIILDDQWTSSAGFYSRELINEQIPGILISPVALQSETTAKRVISHELAHLYFDKTHSSSASWMSEGVALAFESQENAEMNLGIRDAFDHPEISLTGDFDPRTESYAASSHQAAQYGNVQLYFQFLYRRCGKEKFLERLLLSKAKNQSAFQQLSEACKPGLRWKSFNQIFKAFVLAKHTQDYLDPDLYVIKSALNTPVLSKTVQLREPYSSSAYRLQAGKKCGVTEIPLENSVCLQIRYQ